MWNVDGALNRTYSTSISYTPHPSHYQTIPVITYTYFIYDSVINIVLFISLFNNGFYIFFEIGMSDYLLFITHSCASKLILKIQPI